MTFKRLKIKYMKFCVKRLVGVKPACCARVRDLVGKCENCRKNKTLTRFNIIALSLTGRIEKLNGPHLAPGLQFAQAWSGCRSGWSVGATVLLLLRVGPYLDGFDQVGCAVGHLLSRLDKMSLSSRVSGLR